MWILKFLNCYWLNLKILTLITYFCYFLCNKSKLKRVAWLNFLIMLEAGSGSNYVVVTVSWSTTVSHLRFQQKSAIMSGPNFSLYPFSINAIFWWNFSLFTTHIYLSWEEGEMKMKKKCIFNDIMHPKPW